MLSRARLGSTLSSTINQRGNVDERWKPQLTNPTRPQPQAKWAHSHATREPMDAGICPFLFRSGKIKNLLTGDWPAQAAAVRCCCLVMWPKMSKQTHTTLAGLVGNILECKSLTATQLSAYTSLKRQRWSNTHCMSTARSHTAACLSLSPSLHESLTVLAILSLVCSIGPHYVGIASCTAHLMSCID